MGHPPKVIKSLDDWRKELRDIDAELLILLHRRMQLAIELLALLRGEHFTLGELEHDVNRLGILLSTQRAVTPSPLDEQAVKKIFRRIIIEEKRLAEAYGKDNGLPDNSTAGNDSND
jgi:chorismate mutase